MLLTIQDASDAGVAGVDVLQIVEAPGAVLGDDVHRQQSLSSTLRDQGLCGVEVAFPETVLLKDVAPATGRDLKIECRLDFQDSLTEGAEVVVELGPRGTRRAASRQARQGDHGGAAQSNSGKPRPLRYRCFDLCRLTRLALLLGIAQMLARQLDDDLGLEAVISGLLPPDGEVGAHGARLLEQVDAPGEVVREASRCWRLPVDGGGAIIGDDLLPKSMRRRARVRRPGVGMFEHQASRRLRRVPRLDLLPPRQRAALQAVVQAWISESFQATRPGPNCSRLGNRPAASMR